MEPLELFGKLEAWFSAERHTPVKEIKSNQASRDVLIANKMSLVDNKMGASNTALAPHSPARPRQDSNVRASGIPSYAVFGSPSKSSHATDLDDDEMEDLKKLVLNSADKRAICPEFSDSPEIRPRTTPKKPDLNPEFLFQPMDSEVQPLTKYLLPPKAKELAYTLVVDLDETLVHFDREKKLFYVRPYTRHFLRELSKYFEIVIFTAAQQDYTDFILQKVDIEGIISHRLYREHTVCVDGVYIKDLSRIGRDLATTIIVDNNPKSFQLQPSNGVYVRTWTSDPNDKALLRLATILADVASKGFPDIRRALRRLKDKMMAVFAVEGKMPQEVQLSSEYSTPALH